MSELEGIFEAYSFNLLIAQKVRLRPTEGSHLPKSALLTCLFLINLPFCSFSETFLKCP